MIKYYEHPYLLASSFNNFQKDFYKKYIVNKTGGSKKVGNYCMNNGVKNIITFQEIQIL